MGAAANEPVLTFDRASSAGMMLFTALCARVCVGELSTQHLFFFQLAAVGPLVGANGPSQCLLYSSQARFSRHVTRHKTICAHAFGSARSVPHPQVFTLSAFLFPSF